MRAAEQRLILEPRPPAGRLALVADIHGNLPALDAVVRALADEGLGDVLCLGDVAATGPHPHEVLERLRELGWPTVLGNADAWLLEPDSPEGEPTEPGPPDADDPFRQQVRDLDLWCAERLDPEDRAFLAGLPATVQVVLGPAWRLLGFHGSPRSMHEVLQATTPEEVLDRALQGNDANVLAGGHSHQVLLRRHRDRLLLNPGSVGIPFERMRNERLTRTPARAELAVLTWSESTIDVAFRQVALDNGLIAAAYEESGMPHADVFTAGRRGEPSG